MAKISAGTFNKFYQMISVHEKKKTKRKEISEQKSIKIKTKHNLSEIRNKNGSKF